MHTFSKLALLCAGLMLAGQAVAAAPQFGRDASMKDATKASMEKNRQETAVLDFGPQDDFADAERGFIAPLLNGGKVVDKNGKVVWDLAAWDFDKQGKDMTSASQAPATVNPSLWRQYKLNMKSGLFKVTDRIYQVRGADISNLTVIEGDTGLIVADPLISEECAKVALDLYYAHRPKKPVKYVIYSHSHIDHYGGVKGIVSPEDVKAGKVQIVAPEGFMQAAMSENVNAGVAMGRRAHYMYGDYLKPGPKGHVGTGLGIMNSLGTTGIIPPTIVIEKDGQTVSMDGLDFVFLLAPNTEAPAEMHWYIPALKALTCAENCCHTMHNLYTLRGAEVRDASAWASYILEAEMLFGDKTDVVFQSHNWPHWDTENIKTYMENTAAAYQFIHDQTLHYANLGYTSTEIANMIKLPDALNKVWYTRQYYGTLSHNAKAVYQKYLGWYDANPVNLNPLSPEDTAKKWMEYLGDTAAVLEKARQDFEKGEYQWVAQVTKELVFADPSNQEARNLCADALEQLGYQAESGTWRNAYLSGALELREGNLAETGRAAAAGEDNRLSMTAEMMLDYIRICTDSEAAQNAPLSLNLILTDTGESFYIKRVSGVLLYCKGVTDESADATVTCTKLQLLNIMLGSHDLLEGTAVEGDTSVVEGLPKFMTPTVPTFNIIEP